MKKMNNDVTSMDNAMKAKMYGASGVRMANTQKAKQVTVSKEKMYNVQDTYVPGNGKTDMYYADRLSRQNRGQENIQSSIKLAYADKSIREEGPKTYAGKSIREEGPKTYADKSIREEGPKTYADKSTREDALKPYGNKSTTRQGKSARYSDKSEIIRMCLDERKVVLKNVLRAIEINMKSEPEGSIYIKKHDGTVQYYQKLPGAASRERYISKSNSKLIEALLQKKYDHHIYMELKQELLECNKYYKSIMPLENIYEGLPDHIKKLVQPHVLTKKKREEEWLAYAYEKKKFAPDYPEHYTSSGLRVRSKSEIMIAEMLEKYQIPFRYEAPIRINHSETWYPDFTILNVRTGQQYLLEHFGLMDEEEYREKCLHKMDVYMENGYYQGINIIYTFESINNPFNSKKMKKIVESYFM